MAVVVVATEAHLFRAPPAPITCSADQLVLCCFCLNCFAATEERSGLISAIFAVSGYYLIALVDSTILTSTGVLKLHRSSNG